MAGEYYDIDSESEPKIVQHPDKIETGGIATCMGVGILNHRTRKGYLGHYFNFDTSSEALVNRAIKEAQNMGDLEVALAGNIPLSREDVVSSGNNFEGLLELYRAHGRWALQMVSMLSRNCFRSRNYFLFVNSRQTSCGVR
ncbi:MAG: hypothetical protein Q7K43_01535 [Candidatus Woesearchaeota archaeon]|nr:hypothetical protein [Candidatus Woesearchaeota archaeon]